MSTDPSPPSSLPRRLLKGGCCCSFVLLGAGVAAIVLLPGLVGGVVARGAAESFAEEHQGRLEIEDARLAWTRRQRVEGVELFAPSGERVATASVELPSLLYFLRADGVRKDGGALDLGEALIELTADVRIDEEGNSNLAAALAPRRQPGAGDEAPSPESRPRGGQGDPNEVRFALRLSAPELKVTDARLPEGHRELVLRDTRGVLDLVDGELGLKLSGACQEQGSFELGAAFGEFQRVDGEMKPTRWSASLDAEDFPAALVDALTGSEVRSAVVVGDLLTARAALSGSLGADEAGSTELSLEVAPGPAQPPVLTLAGEVRLDQDLVRPELQAKARLTSLALAELVRDRLPEGTTLRSLDDPLELGLRLEGAELPRGGPRPREEFDSVRLVARLSAGSLEYTDATLAGAGESLALGASETELRLDHGRMDLSFAAPLQGAQAGSVAIELGTPSLAAWSVEGGPEATATLRASLRGVRSELLDLYTAQHGLLTDVLGPAVDVDLSSAGLSPRGGALQLAASSRLGTLEWDGRLDLDEAGELTVSSGEAGKLAAAVGLSPLMGERVVGPLVPLLVDLRKPDASPIRMKVEHITFPLASGLRGLNADVSLDLGQVTCSFLPSVLRQLPGLEGRGVQRTTILPLELRVVDGVVHYDRLPLKVDGRPLALAGSYDLVTEALDLSTDVKLGDLGGEVGGLLKDVRKVLGDSYAVPLHIGGTPSSPKVSLPSGFLERALKDAGQKKVEDELSRGLKKLFGD